MSVRRLDANTAVTARFSWWGRARRTALVDAPPLSRPVLAVPRSVSSVAKAPQPTAFGSFGKDAKDLFKKQFDFENQLIYKTNSPYAIETRIVAANDAPLRGVFKSTIRVSNRCRQDRRTL